MCVYTNSLDFCYKNKVLSLESTIGFPAYTLPAVLCFSFYFIKGN